MSKFDDRVKEAMRSEIRELWLAFQDRDEAPTSVNRDEDTPTLARDIKAEMLGFEHDAEYYRTKIPNDKQDDESEDDPTDENPKQADSPLDQFGKDIWEATKDLGNNAWKELMDTLHEMQEAGTLSDKIKKPLSELNRVWTNLEARGLKTATWINTGAKAANIFTDVLTLHRLNDMQQDLTTMMRRQAVEDKYIKELESAAHAAQQCCSAQTQLLENVVIPEIEDIDPGKSNGLVRNESNRIINEIRRSASSQT